MRRESGERAEDFKKIHEIGCGMDASAGWILVHGEEIFLRFTTRIGNRNGATPESKGREESFMNDWESERVEKPSIRGLNPKSESGDGPASHW